MPKEKHNLYGLMLDAIYKLFGSAQADTFTRLYQERYSPDAIGVATPSTQITMMNTFWRNLLMDVEDSHEIRAWLCEGNNILAYVQAFEQDWGRGIAQYGVLD